MDFNKVLKAIGPHAAIIIGGLLIVIFYFLPLFQGKVLKQSDIEHFNCITKEISDYRAKTGAEPLWTGTVFSGMPAYQISMVNSGNIPAKLNQFFADVLQGPPAVMFLLFLGFYILLISLKVDPWLAGLGAVAYLFSSYFFVALDAGHNSKINALAYLPPLLGGIILTYNGKIFLGATLTALFAALEVSANHYQITYYGLLMIVPLVIIYAWSAIREKKMKTFLIASVALMIAGAVGAGTDIAHIWQTEEYGRYSIRGIPSELTVYAEDAKKSGDKGVTLEYMTDWSYGVGESFTLLVPNFYGGGSRENFGKNSETYKLFKKAGQKIDEKNLPGYWGDQPFTSGPVYIGAIICFLFVLGLIIVPGKLKWWLLVATILSLFIAWGKNMMWFTELLYYYMPMYGKFRAVSTGLVIAEICMPILAVLALSKILKLNEKDRLDYMRPLYIAGGIVLGLLGFFALLGPSMFSFQPTEPDASLSQPGQEQLLDAIISDRASLLRADSLRSFLFVAAAFGLLWAFLKGKLKMPKYGIALILTGLVAFDLIPIAYRYVNSDDMVKKTKEQCSPPTQADLFIQNTEKDISYRVFNNDPQAFNDATTSYHHKSVGGYTAAKFRKYQELFEQLVFKQGGNFIEIMNMLNAKWFIQKKSENSNEKVPAPNATACGNAWFVKDYKLVENADAEIEEMRTFKAKDLAVIRKDFADQLNGFKPVYDSTGSIRLDSYEPNHLKYSSSTSSDQVAVFSEIYYDKGWNAYIDGQPAKYFKTNYVLRGMKIPAGKHSIEFKFEPQSYYTGNKISMIMSWVLMIAFVGAIAFPLLKKKKDDEDEQAAMK